MTNLLQKFEEQQIQRIAANKRVPDFRVGDTVRVGVRIVEIDGKSERIQSFEGLCIAIKRRGINSSFTVRKISHGEGVERVFPLYSPRVDGVEIVRKGVVSRAKLYYMRALTGKAARIEEKHEADGGAARLAEAAEIAASKVKIEKGPRVVTKKDKKPKK